MTWALGLVLLLVLAARRGDPSGDVYLGEGTQLPTTAPEGERLTTADGRELVFMDGEWWDLPA